MGNRNTTESGNDGERDRYRAEANRALQIVNQKDAEIIAANDVIESLKAQLKERTQERDNYRAEADQALRPHGANVGGGSVTPSARDTDMEKLRTERDNYKAQLQATTQERNNYREEAAQVLQRLNQQVQYAGNLNQQVQYAGNNQAELVAANDRIERLRAQLQATTQERDNYREEADRLLRRVNGR